MSESADALRAAAAILLSKANELDGGSVPSGFDVGNWRTWWPAMLRQYENDGRPHVWRDAGPGVPITDVGDGDDSPELDDLLRAFRPFCDALTREGQLDSTGQRFYVPAIKKRGGIGLQSVRLIRDEIRGAWYSAWGEAWRAHPLNAPLLPKPETVEALFAKVYA